LNELVGPVISKSGAEERKNKLTGHERGSEAKVRGVVGILKGIGKRQRMEGILLCTRYCWEAGQMKKGSLTLKKQVLGEDDLWNIAMGGGGAIETHEKSRSIGDT